MDLGALWRRTLDSSALVGQLASSQPLHLLSQGLDKVILVIILFLEAMQKSLNSKIQEHHWCRLLERRKFLVLLVVPCVLIKSIIALGRHTPQRF